MERWCPRFFLCILAGAGACAHVETPTGGPEIRGPLEMTEIRPDSLVVVPPFRGPIVFAFERRLSEQGLREAVSVSPETSPVSVSHSGRELRVSLRNGWEPGVIYHVTLLPAFQDLWGNRPVGRTSLVFSTGPEIPDTRMAGQVVDRITGSPEIGIRVEAIRRADSLVYAIQTDSSGVYIFDRVPEGEYQLRGYRDLNRNRQLDEFEPRDTARIVVVAGDSVGARLRVVQPDSIPPIPQRAELVQGIIEVEFDDYLEPAQQLDPVQVEILDDAGRRIPVSRLAVGRFPEDTAVEDEGVVAPVPDQPPAAPDTVQEPLPSRTLAVEAAEPLVPDSEYTIRLSGIVNVVGLAGDGEVTLVVPVEPTPEPTEEGEDIVGDQQEADDLDLPAASGVMPPRSEVDVGPALRAVPESSPVRGRTWPLDADSPRGAARRAPVRTRSRMRAQNLQRTGI
jgi:hypothetical protein